MLNLEHFRINFFCSVCAMFRCLVVCMRDIYIYKYIFILYIYVYICFFTYVYTYPLRDPLPVSQDDGKQNRHGEDRVWLVKMDFGYRGES